MPAAPGPKKNPDFIKRHPLLSALLLWIALELLILALYFSGVIRDSGVAGSLVTEIVPLGCVVVAVLLSIRKMF